MSGYRRFVAYVYEYQKGKKGSNCGFIKVEVRDQRCSMEVHLHCSGLTPQVECKIYGFVRKDGLMNGILLGSCETEEDTAECLIETDSLNMGGSGVSLGRMGGMVLVTDLGGFFGTEWDDQPIRPENFREVKVPAETKSQKSVNERKESDKKESPKAESVKTESDKKVSDQKVSERNESTVSEAKAGGHGDEKSAQSDLEAEESRQDVQGRENDSGEEELAEEQADGKDGEVSEEPVEAEPEKIGTSADFEAEAQVVNEARENIGEKNIGEENLAEDNRADKQQQESAMNNVAQGEAYTEFEKSAEEEVYEESEENAQNVMVEEEYEGDYKPAENAAVKEEYEESEGNAAAGEEYAEHTLAEEAYVEYEEDAAAEKAYMEYVENAAREKKYAESQQNPVADARYRESEENNGGAAGTRKDFVPEQDNDNSRFTSDNVSEAMDGMRQPQRQQQVQRPSYTPPRPMQNTPPRPAQNTPPRPMQNTPPRPAQNTPPRPMQNTPPRPVQNTPPWPAQNTPPRTAQGVPQVPPRTNRSGNSGAMRKRVSFGEPFTPFSDGELVRCWKIQPQDFAYFPRRESALRNNRFLLYGYYNFGHLLLGKKPNGQYILGVPGGYDQQERFMANMFGFPYFKESRLIELPKARGGYWYRLINAPDFH
ncbi:DUF6128 domain-containing protein [Blautia schinkii]|nr:DUF6128 domain-containing protein [Blautia schinkii]